MTSRSMDARRAASANARQSAFRGIAAIAVLSFGLIATAGSASAQGETRFINSADKIPIAYEVHGNGTPALVFVHGSSCDRSYWAAQIPAFSQRFTVVTLDLGGHGQSGIQRKDWTLASYGRDVEAVVQALRLRRIILIGHSMGGEVVVEAARRLKRKTAGLIWLDTHKQLNEGQSPQPRTCERARTDYSLSQSREIGKDFQDLRLPVIAIDPDDTPTDAPSMTEDPAPLNRLLRTSIDQLLSRQDR